MTLTRKRLYDLVEAGDGDNLSNGFYDVIMIIVIVASLVPLAFKGEHAALIIIDKVCAGIFILDYLLRWFTADYKFDKHTVLSFVRYPFCFAALIDLLSILPSLTLLNSAFKVIRVARLGRLLRVLRVFKAARYSKSIQIIANVFKKSKEPLAAVGSLAVIYVLISALIIINAEPETFGSYFDAVYWATVSLTTMGYGDIYPVTVIGRIITMLSSVFGIAIVALPSGIITAGYMAELEKQHSELDYLSSAQPDKDTQKEKKEDDHV